MTLYEQSCMYTCVCIDLKIPNMHTLYMYVNFVQIYILHVKDIKPVQSEATFPPKNLHLHA